MKKQLEISEEELKRFIIQLLLFGEKQKIDHERFIFLLKLSTELLFEEVGIDLKSIVKGKYQ